MPSPRSRKARTLSTYYPMLDRAIFGIAVLGILTSVHLGIQQERGFDQGCFGFSASQQVEDTFDCAAVTQSDAGQIFGLSNSIWGLLFYIVVAGLTALAAFNVQGRISAYKKSRAALILLAFVYTLYLVYYQFFGIGELCALCLTSAGLTTILFVLQIVDIRKGSHRRRKRPVELAKAPPRRELVYMGAVSLIVILLIGADFAYYRSLDTPLSSATQEAQVASGDYAAPQATSTETPASISIECGYDPQKAPVAEYAGLVNFFDPAKGSAEADVTVIEYFDPNCPHCKTLHPIVDQVAETHGDRAHFVFKPFVLWNHSIMQSEALYAAAQEGKFFEMLDHQYAMQQPETGLSEAQLRQIAEQIGMDPDVLMQRISSGVHRRTLAEQKEKGAAAGVTGTPAILINGRFISGRSRTADCLRELIDAAARG